MYFRLFLIPLLFIASLFDIIFALSMLKKNLAAGSRSYSFLLFASCIYCLGYAFELSSETLPRIFVAIRIEYIGISFFPVYWLTLALQVAGKYPGKQKQIHAFLVLISLAFMVIVFTNNYHRLYYRAVSLNPEVPFSMVLLEKGPLYYCFVIYTDICLLYGNIILLQLFRDSIGPFRRQAFHVVLASLIPWAGSLVYQIGKVPYNLDVTPIILSITGPFLGFTMSNLKTFKFSPVARKYVFEELAEPVIVLTPNGLLADFNSAASELFDALISENIGRYINELPGISGALVEMSNIDDKEKEKIIVIRKRDEERHYRIVKIVINNTETNFSGIIISLTNLTMQIKLQSELANLASRDSLTGLYNRRFFYKEAEKEFERAIRTEKPLAIIMVDLDLFKLVNDSYGHEAGDHVLVNVSGCIESNLRNFDVLGRYGGEEFIILLPETDVLVGGIIAERLRLEIEKLSFDYCGSEIFCTASFGVSGFKGGKENLAEIISAADEALYMAKEKGRNRVEISTKKISGC